MMQFQMMQFTSLSLARKMVTRRVSEEVKVFPVISLANATKQTESK